MSNLKISIITICYNNVKDIRPTIESVINQSYKNIEYIVVDGGSTDGTLNILQEYSNNIAKLISERDRGLYDAMNKGLKLATGDIAGLINGGDRIFDTKVVEKIADHFSNNDIDVIYGHSILVNNRDIPVRINKSPEYRRNLVRWGWMPSHQSIYLKLSLLEKIGYYNLDMHDSADYEFFLRYFYFNKLKIKRLNEFIVRFSMGGRSTKNVMNNLKVQKHQTEGWRVNGEKPPFYLVPMKLMRKPIQFLRAPIYRIANSHTSV